MRHSILLSTAAGSGLPADDARLAALAMLLRRRAQTPLAAVVANAAAVRVAHPDLHCIHDSALAGELSHCELLCVSFAARADARQLERAALHAAMARASGVPVAVVAAEIGGETPLWRFVLAGCESVSAAEAATAAQLGPWHGRHIEIVAPPELVLELDRDGGAARRGRVALDALLADALDAAAFEALRAALRAFAPRALVVLGEGRRSAALAEAAPVEPAGAAWPVWARALASCDIVITGDASIAAVALAASAVPVVAGSPAPILSRLALDECRVGGDADAAAWARALGAATRLQRVLPARVAPLRALAWRALGPLAHAARATAPELAPDVARDVYARACAALAAPALERGDAAAAVRILDAWEAPLGGTPAWAEARAHADALWGRDRDAVTRLLRAANSSPDHAGVQAALARAHVRTGDLAAALVCWRRCADLAPTSAEPWAEIAQLELAAGRVVEALDAFAACQAREPGHTSSARAVRALLASEPEREAAFWRALCDTHAGDASFWRSHAEAATRAGFAADARASRDRAEALAAEVWPRMPAAAAGPARDGAPEPATVAGGPAPGV